MNSACRNCPFNSVCSSCDVHTAPVHEVCSCCEWPEIKTEDLAKYWEAALSIARHRTES